MTGILDVLMIIIKEIVEAIPACVTLPEAMELMTLIREDFATIFSYLPTILSNEYLNPILAIPDLLMVIGLEFHSFIENCCSNAT